MSKVTILLPIMSLVHDSDRAIEDAVEILENLPEGSTLNEDGEIAVPVEMPTKREVCHRCEGYGTHLNPSIGEHAYTREEFYEAFYDEEDREQYFRRGGIYDVQCVECRGERVVDQIDREACKKSQNPLVRFALEFQDLSEREERDYQRMCADERRFGC